MNRTNSTTVEESSSLAVVTDRRRATVASVLETLDGSVTIESDPLAAIEQIEATAFECIVCETTVSSFSGLELLGAIRERDGTVPVVVLGSDDDDPIVEHALGDQSAYVPHPGDSAAIGRAVNALLEANGRTVSTAGDGRQSPINPSRYVTTVNTTGDGVVVLDGEQTITRVNDRLCALTERARDELIGEPVDVLFESGPVTIESDTVVETAIDAILTGSESELSVELPYDASDRADGVLEMSLTELPQEDGALATVRDVTANVRKELALERINEAISECALTSDASTIASKAIEAVEDAFDTELASVWYESDDGQRLELAQATAELRELLAAAGDPPFVHDRGDRVWDAYRTGGMTTLSGLTERQLAADVPVQSALIASLGEHGIISMARPEIRAFSQHERDLTRILARSIETALDRLEREQSLERNRDLLRRTQHLADLGPWRYDVDSETVTWNEQTARVFDADVRSPQPVEAWLDIFRPADRERIDGGLERASAFGIGFDYRVQTETPGGRNRWLRLVGDPVEEDGTVTTVRGAVRNVTAEYERRRQLQRNESALRDLHEVVTDQDRTFDERIDAIIEVGRERIGFPVGYLTAIDEGVVEVSRVVGDTTMVKEGQRFPIEETLCRMVIDEDDVIGFQDVVADGLADDPANQRFGFTAYVGAPFSVEGEPYGTICFVDSDPRNRHFSTFERAFVRILVQEVGALFARRHRREQLQALQEATRSLFEATATEDIPQLTVESVDTIADSLPVAFYEWDEDRGELVLRAQSTQATHGRELPERVAPGDSPIWDGFVRGTETFEALRPGGASEMEADAALVMPVGEAGVLVANRHPGSDRGAFEGAFLETLARNVTAALETVEQTETLQEYTTQLQRQNERLERLGRINAIIRDIQQTLVEAQTRSEIEQAVCANLTAVEHWELAWMGGPTVGETVEVRATSGERATALSGAQSNRLESTAGVAFEEQRIVVTANLLTADGPEPWRRTALEAGYQSAVSVPISYGPREYGVLEIYADRPGEFSGDERSVLAELGTTIADAIAGVEQERILQSGGGVELEFTIPRTDEFFLDLGASVDGELTITNLLARGEEYLAYATATDAAAAADALDDQPLVLQASAFGSNEDGQIEFAFPDAHLLETLSAYDARFHHMVATDETNHLTVRLPRSDQIRAFLEHVEERYPRASLQAQRTIEAREAASLADAFQRLTDRQREVVTVAYRRGFFEWPRESSGEAVADALGIAPATFHQHLRTVERTFLDALFDDE